MTDYATLKQRIEADGIEFVDFRVADLVGRFRHLTVPAARFTETLLKDGVGFDGSNFGFRGVHGSDMVLKPDLSTAYVEERDGEAILTLLCDVYEADTREPAAVDPRGVARRAVGYLRERGIADDVLVSPEFEFYVFSSIDCDDGADATGVRIDPVRGCENLWKTARGDAAYSAYHAPLPQDRMFAIRCEISREIERIGIPVKYHHHEVGPYGQQEIELGFAPLVEMADAALIVKSLVRNVVAEMGYTATFLPKPLFGEAGNGMHLHQYLVRGGKNLFTASDGLSDLALLYIGGLLVHGRSLMGLTNPSTNSYRRLVPGYEAPVHLVFGAGNRSAAVRIPTYATDENVRIELRTMDAACNPYLAFAAILMAGMDGIVAERHAARLGLGPFDNDLYENGAGEEAPHSLSEAMDALQGDQEFLLAGGVFSQDGLEQWTQQKRREAAAVASRPHPYEFSLYYDL